MSTLQIKRGKKVNLPSLKEGEFGYCSDTKELYIGTTSGNVLVTGNLEPGNLTAAIPIVKGGTGAATAAEALVNLGALAQSGGDASNVITKFTVASSVGELTTGEKLSVAFGKIAKAVSSLISHLANVSNPHSVTKAQVGLGSCDNTSDSNKPVSTAQKTYIDGFAKKITVSGKTVNILDANGNILSTITTQDTVYAHPTGAGNNHIPSGGTAGQILKYSASGVAAWSDDLTNLNNKNIDGVSFGSDNSVTRYAVCSSGVTVGAKVATITAGKFSLDTGARVTVKFEKDNVTNAPELNVNNTGSKKIYLGSVLCPANYWKADDILDFVYDGTYWRICESSLLNDLNTDLINKIYPVGSIYMSANNVSPATFLGGTWVALQDRFLIGAGGSYSANSTGGASEVALSSANMPAHTHGIPALSGTAVSAGAHTHTPTLRYKSVPVTSSGSVNRPFPSTDPDTLNTTMISIASAGAHTHTVTTVANTSVSAGSGSAHNNMPPYLAVYMWKRTA